MPSGVHISTTNGLQYLKCIQAQRLVEEKKWLGGLSVKWLTKKKKDFTCV